MSSEGRFLEEAEASEEACEAEASRLEGDVLICIQCCLGIWKGMVWT